MFVKVFAITCGTVYRSLGEGYTPVFIRFALLEFREDLTLRRTRKIRNGSDRIIIQVQWRILYRICEMN